MRARERSERKYQALAEFRYQIRLYLNFSERAARTLGIEPHQYQALLAVKGMPDGRKATIGALAEQLQVRHHSTVELVDRLESQGLLRRSRSAPDRREVLVQLTGKGERLLHRLARTHRAELRAAGPALIRALEFVVSPNGRNAGVRRRSPQGSARRSLIR
jgi:DNA-binding MarR family transcriptional regulator